MKPKCSHPTCARISDYAGMCQMHYIRRKMGKDMDAPPKASKGSGTNRYGYRVTTVNGKKLRDHITVVEKILGKPLPPKACIHHINEDRSDNRPENLVVCQDQKYHMLIHRRMRALEKCGNANWMPCVRCHNYDDPTNMRIYTDKRRGWITASHKSCCRKLSA
jgi:hypothetical protein